MKVRALPLGIDIGATRVRVAEAERCGTQTQIRAVAVRDVPARSQEAGALADTEYLAALIEEAISELGTAQRRCVCALGEPDALLRTVGFPRMTGIERDRAARFEAQRFVDFPVEEAVVRVHLIDAVAGTWALGVARTSAVRTRLAALRAAGLRPVAFDHEACALARALPDFDAILDLGFARTNLHVLTAHTPRTLQAYCGGADLTRAIERELLLDAHTAEKRKRILGTAGAGERARAALTADITDLVAHARETQPVGRIALVGNAARLAGLLEDVQAATGALCEMPVSRLLHGDYYPEDVIRSSAPDWTLAAGLALWSAN